MGLAGNIDITEYFVLNPSEFIEVLVRETLSNLIFLKDEEEGCFTDVSKIMENTWT